MLRFLSPLQPALLALPPELAHRLTLRALRFSSPPRKAPDDPRLETNMFGMSFPNPVGMAAGFDKNAEVAGKLLDLGFGFVEVGGVTPRPQTGNPRPRVFRLPEDCALINRLGFNNDGLAIVRARLARYRNHTGIIGVNLGANKDSEDRMQDFLVLIKGLSGLADFVTLNISSPNTPGLRSLQEKDTLGTLLRRVTEQRESAMSRKGAKLPVLVKIAPDLTLQDLDGICACITQHGVDGMIVGNTTIQRPAQLRHAFARESGGLSGRPLFDLSTRCLAQVRQRVGPGMTLVGAGGIDSGETAFAKICAGANLVQLYTGLVYKGLPLLDEIKTSLLAKLQSGGFERLGKAVGCETGYFARG